MAVFTDGLSVQGDTCTEKTILDHQRRDLFKQNDPIPALLNGTLPVFATGLFRTEVMRNLGGFDPQFRCYEDLEMPVLLCRAGKVGLLAEALFCRREHDTNTSTTTATIKTDKILWYRKLLANADFAAYGPLLHRRLRRAYLTLGRHLTATRGGTAAERLVTRRLALCLQRHPPALSSPEMAGLKNQRKETQSPAAARSIFLMTRAGLPAATVKGGTSRVTTLLAPITERLPMRTPSGQPHRSRASSHPL